MQLLQAKPRSGRPLACSPAPDGRSQWSLGLLAGKAVELGYCQRLSASSAHGILKKTRCAPS